MNIFYQLRYSNVQVQKTIKKGKGLEQSFFLKLIIKNVKLAKFCMDLSKIRKE